MTQLYFPPLMWKNDHKAAQCSDLGAAQTFQPEEFINMKSTRNEGVNTWVLISS